MFSKGGTREKIVAVADIESGSAGVAIVKVSAGKPAQILASERKELSFEEREPSAEIVAVLSLLAEAAEKAGSAYTAAGNKMPISDCCVILHEPLSSSTSLRASSVFEKEERITDAMISDLARKAIADSTELVTSDVFESSIIHVVLNGYQTSEPAGKLAHTLEVIALASTCDQSLRTSIESAFNKTFPRATVVIRSALRASVSVVRDTLERTEECLVVDMTGENTNFIRLDAEMSLEHVIMPEGYRTILKKLAKKSMPEDKLSVLRMIERDDASSDSSDSVRTTLAQLEPELLRACGEALGKMATRRRLPEDLVLIVHRDFAPWLSGFFSRIDFTQFTLTLHPFNVHILETDALAHEAWAENTKTDAGLAVAAALVNRESREQKRM